jgi:hypothetical protein
VIALRYLVAAFCGGGKPSLQFGQCVIPLTRLEMQLASELLDVREDPGRAESRALAYPVPVVPDAAHPRWLDLSLLRPATPSSGDEHRLAVCPPDRRQRDLYGVRLWARSAQLSRSWVHGRAGEVLADWENSRRSVTAWLASASEGDLLEPRPNHVGSRTAREVVTILLDEQIHHGPEIALRDLPRNQTPPDDVEDEVPR